MRVATVAPVISCMSLESFNDEISTLEEAITRELAAIAAPRDGRQLLRLRGVTIKSAERADVWIIPTVRVSTSAADEQTHDGEGGEA